MRKFKGHKSHDQIKAQCETQGLEFNDRLHRLHGNDYVVVSGGGCRVLYNTFNGTFFGTAPGDVKFDSSATAHENEPWFQALLEFFYITG